MIQIAPQMRIAVAVEVQDSRKGIDGLARICREVLDADPFSGWLFVFRSRRQIALRILCYDGQGFWLAHNDCPAGIFAGGQRVARRRPHSRPTSCNA